MPCGCVLLAYLNLGIPCGMPRTIHYRIDWRENRSWGMYNISRTVYMGSAAISANGSRANRSVWQEYEHYLVPSGKPGSVRSLYLRGTHTAYLIDDARRTVEERPCSSTWTLAERPAYDPDCTRAADGATRVGAGKIAGTPVILFRETRGRHTLETALAPEFGCEEFRRSERTYNWLGLPTSSWTHEVTS